MSGWKRKRFWKTATAVVAGGGFGVELDGRPVMTPAKAPLIVPTLALAQAIAAEWQAQQGLVDPRTMPLTRSANSAIDKVGPQRAEVAALIAAYGGSDLLCYRAEGPETLVEAQASAWDPALAWSATTLRAPLVLGRGVVPVVQPRASLETLAAQVAAHGDFGLAALHDLVSLSGSLVLGLMVSQGATSAAEAWHVSRIDEDYQAGLWGRDEDAETVAKTRHAAFLQAEHFLNLSRQAN